MPLTPGTRIGPYGILALLGAGGMGEVYRARDAKLSREVALKILPQLFTNDPDRLARFRREAQVLASLNHPNIGHIYGFEDSGPQHALVLELVEGPTLADRIAQGPVPSEEALPIAQQITDALEAAHDHGIIHRDLKPANIKVCDDGTVKVLDFGLAKALDPAPASSAEAMNSPTLTVRATQLGVIIGTAAYMAPEQARGKAVDRRADIWAFGVVLFEMLTGRRPFDGETVTDVMASIVQREPDWNQLPPETSARIHRLLRRCLEKDPRRRLRDIGDARLEVIDALEGRPDIGGAAAIAPARRPSRRLVWWAVAATAALLLVLAGLRWLVPATARVVTRLDVATPPTAEPSVFALSPDGRQIVFAASAQGDVQQRLWIRSMDQTAARQLNGTEEGTQPFWSPDGRSIGFFASGRLKRLDLPTGLIQTLAIASSPRGGTWGSRDVIVFSPTTTAGLMRVATTGGQASPVTQLLPQQYSHRWPQFLPDGRRFLFSTFLGQADTRGLFMASLDGGQPRRLLSGEENGDSAPLYDPRGVLLMVVRGVLLARRFDPDRPAEAGEPVPIVDGVAVDSAMFRAAMSMSPNGVLAHRAVGVEQRQLAWMDRSGRVLGHAGPPDDKGLAFPALSPDGRRVAVSRSIDGNGDVWLIDVNRGTFTRVTSDPGNDLTPLWSSDGTRLVFRSSRRGSFDLFIKPMTGRGGEEEPLVVDNRTKAPMDWSLDGRTLLFVALDPSTGADLWAVPMTGDRKPFAVLRTPFDEMDGHFAPDGRWIVYRSNESGRFEIYIRPFPGPGGSQLVSTSGGQYPRWNPNGEELFYVSPDGQMMSVPLEFSANRQSVTAGASVALFPVHFASGSFISTAGGISRAQYDVSRDGRFLINAAVEGYTPAPISVVLNWDALLKK